MHSTNYFETFPKIKFNRTDIGIQDFYCFFKPQKSVGLSKSGVIIRNGGYFEEVTL